MSCLSSTATNKHPQNHVRAQPANNGESCMLASMPMAVASLVHSSASSNRPCAPMSSAPKLP